MRGMRPSEPFSLLLTHTVSSGGGSNEAGFLTAGGGATFDKSMGGI